MEATIAKVKTADATEIKHPPNFINLTGKRFGRLVVDSRAENNRRKRRWKKRP